MAALKRLLEKARRMAKEWREKRKRERHNKARLRRERKAMLRARNSAQETLRGLERQYDQLEQGPDETDHEFEVRAHKLKVRMVELRKRVRNLTDRIGGWRKRIEKTARQATVARKRVRYWAQVRIPHIKKRIERAKRKSQFSPTGSRVVTWEGKPVAEWLAYRLEVARAAGWRGSFNSGYRSPEHSEALCFQICGAPSCPGRCAGRSSNHTKHVYPEGAIDVGDPGTFAAIMRNLDAKIPGVHIFNALGAADPWHFSSSGR